MVILHQERNLGARFWTKVMVTKVTISSIVNKVPDPCSDVSRWDGAINRPLIHKATVLAVTDASKEIPLLKHLHTFLGDVIL